MITCSSDTPLYIAKRVSEGYGTVGNDGYSLIVVADDDEAEALIEKTLQILGFGTHLSPDPPAAQVYQLRPTS